MPAPFDGARAAAGERNNTTMTSFLTNLVNFTRGLADIGAESAEASTNTRNVIKANGNTLFQQSRKPVIALGTAIGSLATPAAAASVDTEASNHSGLLSITTGTGAAINNTIVTLTFDVPFPAVPHVGIHAANSAAAALAVGARPFATATKTALTITSGGTALASATAYQFSYFCIG